MIISEKQIFHLVQLAADHLKLLEDLRQHGVYKFTEVGLYNIESIPKFLDSIGAQQSTELKEIT